MPHDVLDAAYPRLGTSRCPKLPANRTYGGQRCRFRARASKGSLSPHTRKLFHGLLQIPTNLPASCFRWADAQILTCRLTALILLDIFSSMPRLISTDQQTSIDASIIQG
jgi:hypothetical protein